MNESQEASFQNPISEMTFTQLLAYLRSGLHRDSKTLEVYNTLNGTGFTTRFSDDEQYQLEMLWAGVIRSILSTPPEPKNP